MGLALPPNPECAQEVVVLLHGLGRTSLSMKRLEWALTRAGFHVVNVSYPSRKFKIEQLSENHLQNAIAAIPNSTRKVHFVTHSMGGIILRQYLSRHSITNLGSVVMLATPNQGSELVDYFKRTGLGRWILGPAGCQLGTTQTDLPKQLGAVDFDAGVIAGNRSFNPWFSQILPGADDGKVSVESTKVTGMKEFLVVQNSHTWMMWREETIGKITNFLQTGSFASPGVSRCVRN